VILLDSLKQFLRGQEPQEPQWSTERKAAEINMQHSLTALQANDYETAAQLARLAADQLFADFLNVNGRQDTSANGYTIRQIGATYAYALYLKEGARP